MGALKAGSRMRWMDMFTAEEAHVDPAALLIIRTEADVRAMLPLVSLEKFLCWIRVELSRVFFAAGSAFQVDR